MPKKHQLIVENRVLSEPPLWFRDRAAWLRSMALTNHTIIPTIAPMDYLRCYLPPECVMGARVDGCQRYWSSPYRTISTERAMEIIAGFSRSFEAVDEASRPQALEFLYPEEELQARWALRALSAEEARTTLSFFITMDQVEPGERVLPVSDAFGVQPGQRILAMGSEGMEFGVVAKVHLEIASFGSQKKDTITLEQGVTYRLNYGHALYAQD